MPSQSLTDMSVRSLPVREVQYDAYDSKERGLGIRISPKGSRSFFLWYRLHGQAKRLTIGKYPTFSLAEARQLARTYKQRIQQGEDPATSRRLGVGNEPFRLQDALDSFEKNYRHSRSPDGTPSRAWRETKSTLSRVLSQELKATPLGHISRNDIRTIVNEIADDGRPSAANNAFVAIRTFFNWCVAEQLLQASPCAGLDKPVTVLTRDRFLTDNELGRLLRAAEELGYPYGSLVRFLALTGQRRSEVATMRWSDVSLRERLWTIPATMNKSRRLHVVPLSEGAIHILKAATAHSTTGTYVFSTTSGRRPISGFSKWKNQLDKLSRVDNWRIHDLRRTLTTGLAPTVKEAIVLERILNHTTGSQTPVARIYNRHNYLDQMRPALEAWDAHVQALLTNI